MYTTLYLKLTHSVSLGCEADIVLISFVRSPTRDDPRPSHGFLQDDRRLNVALTRARYQLICVGNVREFHRFVADKTETIHALARDAHDRGIIRTPIADIQASYEALDSFYGPPDKKQKMKSHRY
jgi:AAA domain